MKKEYLPIGTICSTNNVAGKVMIIGYHGVSYNQGINTYDYVACQYPEGILNFSGCINFDAENITTIHYPGYQSEEFTGFTDLLANDNTNATIEKVLEPVNHELNSFDNFSNEKKEVEILDLTDNTVNTVNSSIFDQLKTSNFDNIPTETGYDNAINNELPKENNANNSRTLKFDENGVVIFDGNNTTTNHVETDKQNVNQPGYEFDENGFVIKVANINDENPFHENYETSVQPTNSDAAKWPIFDNIRFDENGVVTEV